MMIPPFIYLREALKAALPECGRGTVAMQQLGDGLESLSHLADTLSISHRMTDRERAERLVSILPETISLLGVALELARKEIGQ